MLKCTKKIWGGCCMLRLYHGCVCMHVSINSRPELRNSPTSIKIQQEGNKDLPQVHFSLKSPVSICLSLWKCGKELAGEEVLFWPEPAMHKCVLSRHFPLLLVSACIYFSFSCLECDFITERWDINAVNRFRVLEPAALSGNTTSKVVSSFLKSDLLKTKLGKYQDRTHLFLIQGCSLLHPFLILTHGWTDRPTEAPNVFLLMLQGAKKNPVSYFSDGAM